jgi:cytochrome P450
MMMAMHPEIQRRAQAEIDSVTKEERLPDIGDIGELPYVEACMKETLRFHPPIPLGSYSLLFARQCSALISILRRGAPLNPR